MGWCAPLILSMNWDFPSPASVSQCEISGKTATFQMDDDGYITLLLPGEEIAQRIYDRHKLLTQVFIQLGVSLETAAADACKVEHDLSDETFEKIKAHTAGGNYPLKN